MARIDTGITLDLGFSAFMTPVPDHLKDTGYDNIQFTLVDCPGHASLIKTIIGGAQIIDKMILVIDITKGLSSLDQPHPTPQPPHPSFFNATTRLIFKFVSGLRPGIQTQTAECLVVGEILMEELIVVLNKVCLFLASNIAVTTACPRHKHSVLMHRHIFERMPTRNNRFADSDTHTPIYLQFCLLICEKLQILQTDLLKDPEKQIPTVRASRFTVVVATLS